MRFQQADQGFLDADGTRRVKLLLDSGFERWGADFDFSGSMLGDRRVSGFILVAGGQMSSRRRGNSPGLEPNAKASGLKDPALRLNLQALNSEL